MIGSILTGHLKHEMTSASSIDAFFKYVQELEEDED